MTKYHLIENVSDERFYWKHLSTYMEPPLSVRDKAFFIIPKLNDPKLFQKHRI